MQPARQPRYLNEPGRTACTSAVVTYTAKSICSTTLKQCATSPLADFITHSIRQSYDTHNICPACLSSWSFFLGHIKSLSHDCAEAFGLATISLCRPGFLISAPRQKRTANDACSSAARLHGPMASHRVCDTLMHVDGATEGNKQLGRQNEESDRTNFLLYRTLRPRSCAGLQPTGSTWYSSMFPRVRCMCSLINSRLVWEFTLGEDRATAARL